MNKQEFFHRPATVGEILGSKIVHYASKDIAEKVMALAKREGLIIPEIVPDNYDSRMRFLKRAPQVVLDTGKTQYDAIRQQITPEKAQRKAMGNLENKEYCGFAWKSLRRNEFKRGTLDESVKGAKLFAWTELSGCEIEARPYNNSEAEFYGGKFKLWIPSRTEKHGRHELTAESVPLKKSKFNPVIWTDLTFTHYCGITGNDFSYRYVKSEDFCAHEVAALEKLAQKQFMELRNRVPYEFIPFPIPTEETVRYYNKLTGQIMVQYAVDGKKRKRPLNKAEREILLWDFVRINGYEASFGVKNRKIVDYEWQSAA